MNKNLELLKELLESGDFHHATIRNIGTPWEGVWFYRKSNTVHRGFEVAGYINAELDKEVIDEAIELVKGTGINMGCYGKG